jgi:hypothetical protein
MKTPITIRIDQNILAAARQQALLENRTMTNLIETALRARIADTADAVAASGGSRSHAGRRPATEDFDFSHRHIMD